MELGKCSGKDCEREAIYLCYYGPPSESDIVEITIGQYCLEPLCETHAKIVPLDSEMMREDIFSNIRLKNDLKVV